MNFIEFIGFIIAFLALMAIFIRQLYEKRFKQNYPEEWLKRQKQKEMALKRLYQFEMESKPKKTLLGNNRYEDEDEEEEEDDEDEFEEEPIIIKTPVKKPPVLKPIAQVKQKTIPTQPTRSVERKSEHKSVYHVKESQKESMGRLLLFDLKSKQQMVILKEILDKPLSLR